MSGYRSAIPIEHVWAIRCVFTKDADIDIGYCKMTACYNRPIAQTPRVAGFARMSAAGFARPNAVVNVTAVGRASPAARAYCATFI